jgi:hypothetical protein
MNHSEPFKIFPQAGTKSKISEPLPVKQLAAALRVSLRFVYQMRACGFPMRGETRQRQAATPDEARAWIEAHNFRLIKSVGVVGTSVPVRVLRQSTSPAQALVAAVQTAHLTAK